MHYVEHEESKYVLNALSNAGYKKISKELDRRMDRSAYIVSYQITYDDDDYFAEFATRFGLKKI